MATLIIEEGTGEEDANVYTSMADSDAYHDSMGHTDWVQVSPDNARIQAKIRGAAYIDRKYATQWPGTRVNGRSQSMAWPREDAYDQEGELIDSESVPREVRIASMEAEYREFLEPGSLSPDVTPAQQVIFEQVGSLAVRYSDTTGVQAQLPVLTEIDEILANIIGDPSSGVGVTWVNRA
jgi:hypothetical protein